MIDGPKPSLTPVQIGVVLLFLQVFAAMGVTWLWALIHVVRRQPLLPRRKPARVPWGGGSVLAVVGLYLGLSIGVANAITMGSGPDRSNPADSDVLVIISVVNALAIGLVPRLLSVISGASWSDLGLTRTDLALNLGRGVVACLLLAPVCYGLMLVLSQVWEPEKHPALSLVEDGVSGRVAFLTIMSAVVLAPVAEELLFRGVLLGWLESLFLQNRPGNPEPGTARWDSLFELAEPSPDQPPPPPPRPTPWRLLIQIAPRSSPNIITSVIFALLHAPQWPAPIPLFVLSLGLGLLYRRTGSLWSSIALHATFNALSTFSLLLIVWSGLPVPSDTAPTP